MDDPAALTDIATAGFDALAGASVVDAQQSIWGASEALAWAFVFDDGVDLPTADDQRVCNENLDTLLANLGADWIARCQTSDPIERKQLHHEAEVWLALSLTRRPARFGRLSYMVPYPNMQVDLVGGWANSDDNRIVLCPAVLQTAGWLPAQVILGDSTLERLLDKIELTCVSNGTAHADALPHNWGFGQLVWDPATNRLMGRRAALFDTKHFRTPEDAGAEWVLECVDRRLRASLQAAWIVAATWTTAVAEYHRQPDLQDVARSPLYAQYWQACQQRQQRAVHTLDQLTTVVINLSAFSSLGRVPVNLAAAHRSLDLRILDDDD